MDMMLYPRRQNSSQPLLYKPQILYNIVAYLLKDGIVEPGKIASVRQGLHRHAIIPEPSVSNVPYNNKGTTGSGVFYAIRSSSHVMQQKKNCWKWSFL
jgi:hypothetical protein